MSPGRPVGRRFTRRGRLESRWATALAEPHPVGSLRLLLALTADFGKHPKSLAQLWLPFVASVLRDGRTAVLTSNDLALLETTGATVAAGSGGALGLDQAWLPLITVRDARREYAAVNAMLTALYWSAGTVVLGKPVVARELARRNARAEEHQAVYVHYLSTTAGPAGEPAIVAVLAGCLAVGFDANPGQLQRGGDLAFQLRAANIAIAGVDLALGYRSLLVTQDPASAARHFEAALFADRSSWPALLGLLSAWLRTGEHDRVLAMATQVGESGPALVGQLAELSTALRWLDNATVPGPPPATADRLAALPVGPQAGEWLGYAVGRLHLVAGDAPAAARLLVPLAEQHPDWPQWHYHAVWSLLLLDDQPGVQRLFAVARRAPDRWTTGCLLMAVDPGSARATADELFAGGLPAGAARIVEARAAFANGDQPAPLDQVPTAGTVAEELELVRTRLGSWFGEPNPDALTAAISSPVFGRAPLAERLLWAGLAALPAEHGRQLLAQANELGYPRAALILAVLSIKEGGDRLDRFVHRSDPTIELVRAWQDIALGADDAALARLTALADGGDPRAHYTLGNLRLRRATSHADFAGAAERFRAALVPGAPDLPDTAILLHCAELAGYPGESAPDLAAQWPVVRAGPASWVNWLAAVAVLAGEPAEVPLDAAERLVTMLEDADAPAETTVVAVARGLTRLGLHAGDAERATAVTGLLGRLTQRCARPEVTRLLGLVQAHAVRRDPAGQLTVPSAVGALALAERSLGGDDDRAAADHLRVVVGNGFASRFCRLAADLLDDLPIADIDVAGFAPESRTGTALRLLVAASVANAEPGHGMDLLAPLLLERELTGLVDLRHVLPVLCANTGRQQPPEYLVRLVRAGSHAGLSPRTLARCATVLGEPDAAKHWRSALAHDPDARAEYATVLRHQAVAARRAGDDLRAVGCLLLSAAVARADEARILLCRMLFGQLANADAPTGVELLARQLVLETCTDRLLGYLFPAHPAIREHPGRLQAVEQIIGTDLRLLFSLLHDDRKSSLGRWQDAGYRSGYPVELLHTLGVLAAPRRTRAR